MTEHYYTEKPVSELKLNKVKNEILGKEFSLISASGIFSKDRLDRATKLLVETIINEIEVKGKVLDIGCGNGVIGISLKKFFPGVEVVFSDINLRAVSITKKNLILNSIKAKVIHSDLFEKVKGKFDLIISNPPMSAGRKICFSLIEQSKEHLEEGGKLILVARHNKGGKILEEKMEEVFGNVEELDKKGGFRVYCSIK